jgi:nucleoside-diphosphate-sugar epimerase
MVFWPTAALMQVTALLFEVGWVHKCILVTGGAGFIGSNFVLRWVDREAGSLVNLDRLKSEEPGRASRQLQAHVCPRVHH